jgi:hypothetical protein
MLVFTLSRRTPSSPASKLASESETVASPCATFVRFSFLLFKSKIDFLAKEIFSLSSK